MKDYKVTYLVEGYEASNSSHIRAKDKENAEQIVKESLELMLKLSDSSLEIISVEEQES